MQIYSHFIYNEQSIFLVLNNLDQYQKLYYKDSTTHSFDSAKYEYLFKVIKYIYTQMPNVKLVDCELENVPSLENLVAVNCQFDNYTEISIYVPVSIEDKVFYLFNKGLYAKWLRDCDYFINNIDDNLIYVDAQIVFSLIHGIFNITYRDLLEIKSGDVLMLDDCFAPDYCQLDVNGVKILFQLNGNNILSIV